MGTTLEEAPVKVGTVGHVGKALAVGAFVVAGIVATAAGWKASVDEQLQQIHRDSEQMQRHLDHMDEKLERMIQRPQ